MNCDWNIVLKKIEKIEKSQQKIGKFYLGLFILLGALLVLGAKTPQVVKARVLGLVDSSGKIRGAFGVDSDGEAVLALSDQPQKYRVKLGVDKENVAYFDLFDPQEKKPIEFVSSREMPSLFYIHGNDGKKGIAAEVKPDGNPNFVVQDSNLKGRALVGFDGNGKPAIGILDDRESERMRFGMTESGPTIQQYDEFGKKRIDYYTSDQEPGISLFDRQGNERGSINMNLKGPALMLLDPGRVLRGRMAVIEGQEADLSILEPAGQRKMWGYP